MSMDAMYMVICVFAVVNYHKAFMVCEKQREC